MSPIGLVAADPREERILWWCLVLFAFSFAFDYRAPDAGFGSGESGGSIFQYLMLLSALGAGSISAIFGRRYLLATPGVWLLGIWFGYLGFSLVSSLFHGVEPGRVLRLMIAPVLIGLGILTSHVALCSGTSPKRLIYLFVIVCTVNTFWQTLFGYATSAGSFVETRPELSPGIRYLFGWAALGLFLSRKFLISPIVLGALGVGICVLCLTRSAVIYLGAALAASAILMVLGIFWKRFSWAHAFRRMGASVGFLIVGVLLIGMICFSIPVLRDWWVDRIFYSDGGGQTVEDMSIMMRKAEAEAMITLLNEEPLDYLWGRGFGASYYWDDDYLPELVLVYTNPENFPQEIHTSGHSLWTYTLFASGLIGVFAWLILFIVPAVQSIYVAWMLSVSGFGKSDDFHLICFAAISSFVMVCSSILENPYDNRLAGPLTGMVAAVPQFYLLCLWRRRRAAEATKVSSPRGFPHGTPIQSS